MSTDLLEIFLFFDRYREIFVNVLDLVSFMFLTPPLLNMLSPEGATMSPLVSWSIRGALVLLLLVLATIAGVLLVRAQVTPPFHLTLTFALPSVLYFFLIGPIFLILFALISDAADKKFVEWLLRNGIGVGALLFMSARLIALAIDIPKSVFDVK